MTSILKSNSMPASRSQKLGALLIDSFFVALLGGICYGLATYFYDRSTFPLGSDFFDLVYLSGPTVYLLVSFILHLSKGATIGNQLMKFKHIDPNTSKKPTIGKLLLRLFYKILRL